MKTIIGLLVFIIGLSETLELIIAIQEWRSAGLEMYFPLDAGSTVQHL